MVQIAEAFTSYRFAETFSYLADDIKWTNVGKDELVGREAVIARCIGATQFLATVSATITKQVILRAADCVVVEGAAQIQDLAGHVSRVASCDVFRFSDGRLAELTSYVIDLP